VQPVQLVLVGQLEQELVLVGQLELAELFRYFR
jgi:hypothetical protein